MNFVISRVALALIAVAAFAPLSRAERPFRTDDPHMVGLYRWEKYGGVSMASGSWDKFRNRTEIGLTAGFDYGITTTSEVGIEAELLRLIDPGKAGLGDANLHFKHMFWQPADWEPTHSFDFRLKIPTASASRSLGSGKPDFGLHWLVGWQSEIWETSGRLGYVHTVDSDLDSRYEVGVATRYRTNYNVRFLGEIYGDSNENFYSGKRIFGSLGVAYEWTPTTVLDFMATIGLSNTVPDVGLTVGFRSRI